MELHQELPEGTASPGRWLRRVGRREFAGLMGSCIEETLVQGGLEARSARRLRWESLRRFDQLLAARTRRVRALTKSECLRELERTHGALLRERLRQGIQLEGLARELVQARASGAEAVLTDEEQRGLEQALRVDLLGLLASSEPEETLTAVLARERARRSAALAGVVARERERIDLLERRIAKLRQAQEEMERVLAELATRAEIDGGLPSIYRSVQGLADDESARAAKVAMLARMFEENVRLQRRGA